MKLLDSLECHFLAARDSSVSLMSRPAAPRRRQPAKKEGEGNGVEKVQMEDIESGLATEATAGILTGKDPKTDKATLPVNIYDSDPNLSVEYLFGSLDGAPLVDAILEWFQVEENDVPWYFEAPDGSQRRAIQKVPLSREIQENTVLCYKQRMLVEGLSQRVAGRSADFAVYISHRVKSYQRYELARTCIEKG